MRVHRQPLDFHRAVSVSHRWIFIVRSCSRGRSDQAPQPLDFNPTALVGFHRGRSILIPRTQVNGLDSTHLLIRPEPLLLLSLTGGASELVIFFLPSLVRVPESQRMAWERAAYGHLSTAPSAAN